jgi:hypothetical protein
MNLDSYVPVSSLGSERILSLYGHHLLVFQENGNIIEDITGKYSFNACAYDPTNRNYILASELSGGDGIYVFNLDNPNWKNKFKNLKRNTEQGKVARDALSEIAMPL